MQHSKRTHTLSVIIPAVSLFLLLFLFLLSGLISLGQQLNSVSPILAWLYGLIVLACLGAGIIWPIVSVWRRPIFSMYMLRYRDGRARFYWCRKLTDNLKKNTELTNEETAQLEDFLKQGNQADDLLIEFFTEKFSPVIDSEIKSVAKTAFVTTAISQTAFYDMFSMLSVKSEFFSFSMSHLLSYPILAKGTSTCRICPSLSIYYFTNSLTFALLPTRSLK